MPRLSREQINTYLKDGYLILPELFDAEEIKEIEEQASSIADEVKRMPIPVEDKGDTFADLNGASVVLKKTSDS